MTEMNSSEIQIVNFAFQPNSFYLWILGLKIEMNKKNICEGIIFKWNNNIILKLMYMYVKNRQLNQKKKKKKFLG